MSEEITLYLADWQYNAGICGLVNILGRENVKIGQQKITFSSDLLIHFQDKYFNFFINTYEKTLSWYKIISYQEQIDYFEATNFETFSEEDLDTLNKYIKDTVKYYLRSASYKAAYPLINSEVDPLTWVAKLNAVGKLTGKETFEDKKSEIIVEVQAVFQELRIIIDYCKSDLGKKYLAGKNVIYTIIRNGWDGISFLLRQTKIPDMYLNYQDYFLDELLTYQAEKTKYQYHCSNCNQPMKNYRNDLNFLNQTGFDSNRKTSHVWNFTNDIAICPMCKLVYSCLPAGFIYTFKQGMFINANNHVKLLLDANQRLQKSVLNPSEEQVLSEASPYMALVEGICHQQNKKEEYDLAEMQIIRYEEATYRFNLLSKRTLKVIKESKPQLDTMVRAGYRENNLSFSLYKLVLQSLFNNENLFYLIQKILMYKLANLSNLYYQTFHIKQMLIINTYFLKEIGKMASISPEQVNEAYYFGEKVKELYKERNSLRKINGISYRLLNPLKSVNRDLFMDVLLNSCSYLEIEVPAFFLKSFEGDEEFKTIGFSFISGLIGSSSVTAIKNEENVEE